VIAVEQELVSVDGIKDYPQNRVSKKVSRPKQVSGKLKNQLIVRVYKVVGIHETTSNSKASKSKQYYAF